jgi:hypothetical protein
MPTSAMSTTRTQWTPLRHAENTQVPDLCPISQSGDHTATDYSLSEIDFAEVPSQSVPASVPIDSLSPEPARSFASRRTPASARIGSSRKHFGSSAKFISPRAEPTAAEEPRFEQDDDEDALLGACAPGDATMLESEEFSMISVDSLPSRAVGHSSPSQALQATEGDASVNHSYMPSSPPAFDADRRTPVPEDLTPENPKAPQPSQNHDADIATPLRESARKSGRALQDALNGPFRESVSRELPSARESIFNGFSSGTRRQLRQSLHTGQSLATPSAVHNAPRLSPTANTMPDYLSPFQSPMRQQESFDSLPSRLTDDRSRSTTNLQPEAEVEYPEVAQASTRDSAAREEPEMSYVDVQKPSATHMQSPPRSSPASELDVAEHSAEDALLPEVEEDDKDIWQEEASRSINRDDGSPQPTDLFLDDLVVKPRRGQLPCTLHRDSPGFQERQNRKASASTKGSSRKSSGVLTPPSSDDGIIADGKKPSAKADSSAKVAADDDLSQSESGDDTGMFFQQNLPSVYNTRTSRHVSDSAKSSFAPSSPLRNTVLDISPMKNVQGVESGSKSNLSAGPSPLRRRLVRPNILNSTQATRRDDEVDTSETQTDSSLVVTCEGREEQQVQTLSISLSAAFLSKIFRQHLQDQEAIRKT